MPFGRLKYIQNIYSVYALVLVLFVAVLGVCPAAESRELFKIGTSDSQKYSDAQPVECPHPEIPAILHEECHKASCTARFCINCEGRHDVTLVASSGNDEVDEIALKTLRRWKFKPAMLNGKPVQSVRKIKVEFEVE